MEYAPIVMFVYNRKDHFLQTYNALKMCPEAKESELYVFSDGAKGENDKANVEDVRETVKKVLNDNDFLSLNLIESEVNKGLAKSIIQGVTEIINKYGRVIVLEDDCVPSPYFLNYMNKALDFYENDKQIGSVAGYSLILPFPEDYKSDVYVTYRSCSWGWATWKEVWDNVDWDLAYINDFFKNRKLIKRFNSFGNDRLVRLYHQTVTNANSWSVKFGAHHIKENLLTVYPRYSYISNIGCDESGVHSRSEDADKMRVDISKAIPDPKFEHVEINPKIQKSFKKVYYGGLVSEVKRFLAKEYIICKARLK